MPRILILCPTHDHADTLFFSIASVRAQRVTDWEMVVIGDGAPRRTAEVVGAIAADDPRVRYISNPKGERYGEAYRDPVIRDSRADIVCHLSDDDLWASNHLETLCALLESADWGAQAPLRMDTDGDCTWLPFHHGPHRNRRRQRFTAGLNYVAYRRDAYLRLPEGWTPAPSHTASDRFMWQKFLNIADLKIASCAASTAIKLPSRGSGRAGRTPEQRVAEIGPWLARINAPGQMEHLKRRASVALRLGELFDAFDCASEASLPAALRRFGLRPVAPDAPGTIAINEAQMDLPLSRHQRREAKAMLRLCRAVSGDGTSKGDGADWRQVLGEDRDLWLRILRSLPNDSVRMLSVVIGGYVDQFGELPEGHSTTGHLPNQPPKPKRARPF
ncbi:MAG: glycosyltransferase [Pseudomonadota bacterium]